MSQPAPAHLNDHHRDTLLRIFEHPANHNIEWHDVVSLLGAVGSVETRHDGKLVVSLGSASVTLTRPKGKDIDVQQVLDLRHLLSEGGYQTVAEELGAKGKEV